MEPSLPPGPRYPSLIQGIGLWARPLAYLEKLRARYGTPFTVRFPLVPPFVAITDPDHIKQIYTAPPDVLHPGEGARVLKPLVGENSVILLDEGAHMEQRKLMLPAFHGEKMEALTGLVTEVTEDEVSSWSGEVVLSERLQALTLEIILRAVFGLDPGPRLDALRERLSALLAYGDRPMSMLPEPPARLLRFLDRVGPMAGFASTRDEVNELLFAQIEERRSEAEAGGRRRSSAVVEAADSEAEAGDRDDVLSMLLEARHEDGSPMSDQELRDELMTLLAAGHETTASTLAWAFERLAREPRVLGELRAEVDAGEGDEYLTATIQETLRRRPVLPNTMPRYVKKPFELGGRVYPVGCCLVANAYLVHHDPGLYPDPYEFRPERFLDSPPGTYTWIPFGGGRRRCLGASFAMLEMKIVLPAVLRHFELHAPSTAHEVPKRRNIAVRPGRGARIALSPRRAPVATPA